jgi:hypothetical protein
MDAKGALVTLPARRGRFAIEGSTLTFTSRGSADCVDDESWTWRVTIPRSGRLDVLLGGACGLSASDPWSFIRISPTSMESEAIAAPDADQGAVPEAADLEGVWLVLKDDGGATGALLSFQDGDSFTLDNHGRLVIEPFEQGRYELDGDQLRLDSGSSDCGAWTWRARLIDDGILRITTVAPGTRLCFVPEGTAEWLLRASPTSSAVTELIGDE